MNPATSIKSLVIITGLLSALFMTACSEDKGNGSAELMASDGRNFACYPLDGFELCVPGISQGQSLMAMSALDPATLDAKLRAFTHGLSAAKARIEQVSAALDKQNASGPLLALAREKNLSLYVISSYFPNFISQDFNTNANFSGPNCYDTALLASGGLDAAQTRYVSLDEFERILSAKYDKVTGEALFGDIVVFDAGNSREHAAFYLGHDLIFQKKGFRKGYGYRIKPIDQAYDAELSEWAPSPLADEKIDLDTSVIKNPRAYYRLKAQQPHSEPLSTAQLRMVRLIDLINDEMLRSAPTRKVAQSMGIMIESIIRQLKSDFGPLGTSSAMDGRLAYYRLVSLADQLFMNIDEGLFPTVYARSRERQINTENCYLPDSPFVRHLIESLYALDDGSGPSEASYQKILGSMATYDRSVCRIPLLAIVKDVLGKQGAKP